MDDVQIGAVERRGQLVDVAHPLLGGGEPVAGFHAPAHGGQRIQQDIAGAVLTGELAQLPVLAVFSERVRGTEQPLQEPGGSQGLDRGDRGAEAFPVTAEPAVRFRPETVEGHVAVDAADPRQGADLVPV